MLGSCRYGHAVMPHLGQASRRITFALVFGALTIGLAFRLRTWGDRLAA